MNIEFLKIIITLICFFISFISLYYLMKNELKKNADYIAGIKIADERRYARSKGLISSLREKVNILQKTVNSHFEEINSRITSIYDLFYNHLDKDNK